jgi:carbon-monoxide dehydrogenase catalytic subunit
MGARTLARSIAAATAAHSEQSRHIAEALIQGSKRWTNACNELDLDKLHYVAIRFGIDAKSAGAEELAHRIANEAIGDHSRIGKEPLSFTSSTITEERLAALQSGGLMPDSIDRAVEGVLNRTSIDSDADPMQVVFGAIACSVADYDSMHISTDLSDVIRGTPRLVRADDHASLKADAVNIAVMDLSPSLLEAMAQAAGRMGDETRAAGSSGI